MTTLRDAASTILLRDVDNGIELYMLHRHSDHAFMGDVWVFPGGKVDTGDRDAEAGELLTNLDISTASDRLDAEVATTAGLYLAAVRETFEEAGILLARPRDTDRLVAIRSPRARRQFDSLRDEIDSGRIGIVELLEEQQLVAAADEFVFMAHWITPEFESHRYDTRFFATLAPPEQTARHDTGETTGGAWWTPSDAIERYRDERIELAPPTLRILERLTHFDSADEALRRLDADGPPTPILPRLDKSGDETTLILGDDPDSVPDGVTRMVMRDGQWFSETSGE